MRIAENSADRVVGDVRRIIQEEEVEAKEEQELAQVLQISRRWIGARLQVVSILIQTEAAEEKEFKKRLSIDYGAGDNLANLSLFLQRGEALLTSLNYCGLKPRGFFQRLA